MRDSRELGRALGALGGLAVAVAAAVGLGSLLGTYEPRIPIQDTTSSSAGSGAADPAIDQGLLDDLFGTGSGTTTPDRSRGAADTDDGAPFDDTVIGDPADPELPVDLPESPVEVPVTPELLSPDELVDFIEDTTGAEEPTGLIDTVTGTVEGLTQTVGGVLGGLLGG